MEYAILVAAMAGIYAAAAYGLDLVTTDLRSPVICQACAMGVGAYSSAILCGRQQWPVAAAIGAGVLVGAAAGLALGLTAAHLPQDRLLLITIVVQALTSSVLENADGITGGPGGLVDIPPMFRWGGEGGGREFLIGAACALAVALSAVRAMRSGTFGRALITLGDREDVANALGIDSRRVRAVAFATSFGIAAGAGAVLGHGLGFIDPSMFTLSESVMILAMVIIGKPGSYWGPILGAALIVGMPECLRYIGVRGDLAGHVRQGLFGILMAMVVVSRVRAERGAKWHGV